MQRLLVALALGSVLVLGCTNGGDALPLGTRAEDCGSCHSAQHEEWSGSRHAASATSPVFTALLPHVSAAWGTTARARCESCHAPRHGGDEGIGCVSCHAAVGNRGESNGALVVDLEAPIAGPFGDAEPSVAHRTGQRSLLASSVLCGTCHEVRGPGLLDEPTLTEYRASAEATIGTSCADCHMPALDPAPIADGATRVRPRREHRFVGIDPAWGASPDAQARALTDARDLLSHALALSLTSRDDGSVEVILQNVGAGHAVPTGATFLRDIWVDVHITDANGTVTERPRVIELGARMQRGTEDVALPTDADHIEPRGIAPGGHRAIAVGAPTDAVRPVRYEASLRARAIGARTLEALALPMLPVIEVATAAPSLEQ